MEARAPRHVRRVLGARLPFVGEDAGLGEEVAGEDAAVPAAEAVGGEVREEGGGGGWGGGGRVGEVADLGIVEGWGWALVGQDGVDGGDVGVRGVALGGLVEVPVEHSCGFWAWRMVSGVGCVLCIAGRVCVLCWRRERFRKR